MMIKTSHALTHYLLVVSVLLASNVAAFHSSAHLVADEASTHVDVHHLGHAEHSVNIGPHSAEEVGHSSRQHSSGSVCEQCLVLSNLSAHASNTYVAIVSEQSLFSLFDTPCAKRHLFYTYLSRAPPTHV